ncbi:hypothetical protein B0H11DRAFT_2006866 [Mycena galericulata]|nr:hypothetical protein B0H11DRAFT_2006866 [Mycena galericulata]
MSHCGNLCTRDLRQLILGLTIPGLVCVVCLLLAFGYTAWNPTSRKHLNRVSFRLLVYAMISNLIFHTSFFVRGIGPSAGCTFVGFFGDVVLFFSACMFFCMALNLQLVLVNGIDGRKMEKYYLIGSLLLVAACNIPALAAGQFGYDPIYGFCWFTNPDPAELLRWVVGVQSSWFLAMSSLEVVLFLNLVLFMIRVQRRTSYARSCQSSLQAVAPIVQYRGIIIRIGLYPLFSCFINFLSCILDIIPFDSPTELNWRLDLLSLCIFCLRAPLYACLAATDPSFLRAVRALRDPDRDRPTVSSGAGIHITSTTRTKVDLEGSESKPSVERETRRGSVDARQEAGTGADGEHGLLRSEPEETDEIVCQI